MVVRSIPHFTGDTASFFSRMFPFRLCPFSQPLFQEDAIFFRKLLDPLQDFENCRLTHA